MSDEQQQETQAAGSDENGPLEENAQVSDEHQQEARAAGTDENGPLEGNAHMSDERQQEARAADDASDASPGKGDAPGVKTGTRSDRGGEVNMDTLLKVPVSLSIEVGRTRMPLSHVLETREGTVIELERLLDEPLDILVNGALIAHGVVVMANDRFGIQITDIVSPQERVLNI